MRGAIGRGQEAFDRDGGFRDLELALCYKPGSYAIWPSEERQES